MTIRTLPPLPNPIFMIKKAIVIKDDGYQPYSPEVLRFLINHYGGDWGVVSSRRREINDTSLHTMSGSIKSVFPLEDGGYLRIFTDDAWETTTIDYCATKEDAG